MKVYVPPQAGCWPLPGHPYENILAPPLTQTAAPTLREYWVELSSAFLCMDE